MTVETRPTRTRGSVEKLLATHELRDEQCERCGFRRRMIVSAWIKCGQAPRLDVGAHPRSFPEPGTARVRPRLFGHGSPSPLVEHRERLPAIIAEQELREALIARARQEDVSVSEVMRRALRRYVGLPE